MGECICYDCGLLYSEFPCDFIIQDELWNLISPTGGHGGILCPNCICRRLSHLGMSAVIAMIQTYEIRMRNSLPVSIFNLCRRIRNQYKAWRCGRWVRTQQSPEADDA